MGREFSTSLHKESYISQTEEDITGLKTTFKIRKCVLAFPINRLKRRENMVKILDELFISEVEDEIYFEFPSKNMILLFSANPAKASEKTMQVSIKTSFPRVQDVLEK